MPREYRQRRVTERLWQEYEAFAGRGLREFSIAYVFVHGWRSGGTPGRRGKRCSMLR